MGRLAITVVHVIKNMHILNLIKIQLIRLFLKTGKDLHNIKPVLARKCAYFDAGAYHANCTEPAILDPYKGWLGDEPNRYDPYYEYNGEGFEIVEA